MYSYQYIPATNNWKLKLNQYKKLSIMPEIYLWMEAYNTLSYIMLCLGKNVTLDNGFLKKDCVCIL